MIKLGKKPDEGFTEYSFSEVANILNLRHEGGMLGRNQIMDILRKCNVLDCRGIAYQRFVDEGYFKNHIKLHRPRVEIRRDGYSHVVGQKGLDFVRDVITKFLANPIPPFDPPKIDSYYDGLIL